MDLTFSKPVQEVVDRVSHFLGLDSPISAVVAEVDQGRIGHVLLLVHPRLMAMRINIAVKKGRWDTYFSRSRSDISEWREVSQGPKEEGHLVPVRAELPASDRPGLSSHQFAVVDSHWHPGRMPVSFTGAINAATLDSRPSLVSVTISGCSLKMYKYDYNSKILAFSSSS